eukprot:TRINITY_DN42623_c0_g1_i1.p1 TRINITY_DN42623_c0_g1~~TRINITY_DN42623_c0_g1_i1.p1  ORF type:complete len:115 (+),score=37.57 TRINITY_DN42623_c0_g1_i1:51-395(+)
MFFFFFQAEDGIRDAQEFRGLGDVYKRQGVLRCISIISSATVSLAEDKMLSRVVEHKLFDALCFAVGRLVVRYIRCWFAVFWQPYHYLYMTCLLYTSDAADEEDSVDLGGRRII